MVVSGTRALRPDAVATRGEALRGDPVGEDARSHWASSWDRLDDGRARGEGARRDARPPLVLAEVGRGWERRRGQEPLRVRLPDEVKTRLWRAGLALEEIDGLLMLTSDVRGVEPGMARELARFGPARGRSVTGVVTGASSLRLMVRGGKTTITLDVDLASRRVASSAGTELGFGYTALELEDLYHAMRRGEPDAGNRVAPRMRDRREYPVLLALFGEGPPLTYVEVNGEIAGNAEGLTLSVAGSGEGAVAFLPRGADMATTANELAHVAWRDMELDEASRCGEGTRGQALASMERGEWFGAFRWPLPGFRYEGLDTTMADELVSDAASVNVDSDDIFRIASLAGGHPGQYGATVAFMLAVLKHLNGQRADGRRIPNEALEAMLQTAVSAESMKIALALSDDEVREVQGWYVRAGQALVAHHRASACAALRER